MRVGRSEPHQRPSALTLGRHFCEEAACRRRRYGLDGNVASSLVMLCRVTCAAHCESTACVIPIIVRSSSKLVTKRDTVLERNERSREAGPQVTFLEAEPRADRKGRFGLAIFACVGLAIAISGMLAAAWERGSMENFTAPSGSPMMEGLTVGRDGNVLIRQARRGCQHKC